MGYFSGTLQKGSQGEETKKWQNFLKSQGYDLAVDGIFGDITDKFTRDYQQKNGLTVDGIVGKNTLAKAGFSDVNTPVSAPTIAPMPTAPKYDTTTWDDTEKGNGALDAYNTAKDAVANFGDFGFSNQDYLTQVKDKIMNRDPFSYDINGDALYQQYKDKYIQQGKMAMGDAIGQASAMTGGYGNSYAQSVGQQAYQAQLENLNDIVPELYQMALNKYNMDGQELYNQYAMLTDDYNREYGVWIDKYGRYMDALGIAQGDYYNGADMFYTEQNNKNDIAGKEFDDAMSIWENKTDNAWKTAEWEENGRQSVIDETWKQKEFDALYGNKTTGVSNVGAPKTPPANKKKGYEYAIDDTKPKTSQVDTNSKAITGFKNSIYPEKNHDAIARKMYGPYTAYVAVQLARDTSLSEAEKMYLITYYGITESDLQYARDKGYDI